MIKFNKVYFFLFLTLLVIETCIAYFLKTGFIRHSFGDFLVVIMLYCLLKSFINIKPIYLALFVLFISFSIEFLQLFNFLETLNLTDNKIAKIVLGNTFHINDLIAYTLGIITVLIIEYKCFRHCERSEAIS
jgi:Protein of unknown function (DUF2809)